MLQKSSEESPFKSMEPHTDVTVGEADRSYLGNNNVIDMVAHMVPAQA